MGLPKGLPFEIIVGASPTTHCLVNKYQEIGELWAGVFPHARPTGIRLGRYISLAVSFWKTPLSKTY